MGAYSGRVDDVDLALIDGRYLLKDLVIKRDTQQTPVDFFTVDAFAIALSWEGLRHGEILTHVKLTKPTLTFLDAKKEENRQTGEGTNWLSVFEDILPITLHELVIEQGTVRFQNLDTEPAVNIALKNLEARLANLTNVKDASGQRFASAQVSGQLFGDSPLTAKADFDPFDFNDFAFAADLKKLRIKRLNDLARAYANIDFKSGHGEIFVELSAQDRALNGYIKPLFQDVNIVSWQQDVVKQNDNPLQLLRESGWGLISALFTNTQSDKIATQIDIGGSLTEADISTWQTVLGALHNAFIEALNARYEQLTPLTDSNAADAL
jgi:hypothetical protein